MTAFDPLSPSTWPMTLTAEQVAAIYQLQVGGVKKCCQLGKFHPAPFRKWPYRWRKSAVLRDVEGPQVSTFARRAG